MQTPLPPGLYLHDLLRRQVEELVGPLGALPPGWHRFLEAVDAEYRRADELRTLLSTDDGAGELLDRYRRLQIDVEELDRATGALRESDRQFRELAETVAAATFVYQGTRFRYVNAAALALTGHTREELLEMSFWDVVHPEDREMVRERGMARQRGEEVPARYEFRVVRSDGSERWVDFTAGLVRYEGEIAALGTAFDVTAHREAVAALRRQALVFDNLYDAVMLADDAGRLVGWNPAAERVYGWTREEALGRGPELWLGRRAEAVSREVFDALDREGRWQGEIRFVRKDGTPGVSETVVVPLLDERGVRVGALGVNRDVTDRKAAEAELRRSEERYRLMVEGSEQVFFYAHDAAGRFEYVSPSVRQVVGHTAEELTGRTYHVLLVQEPGNVAEVDAHTAGTLARDGDLSTYTAEVRHADGRVLVLELVERARVHDGVPQGVEGFARDITARRAAERALRESEERYRSLFEESRDAIYMTTVDGRFVEVNQALVDLLGYSREELLNGGARDLYADPADRRRFRDEIARAGFIRDYETRLLRRGGEPIEVLVSASERRLSDGSVAGYQGIIHDITKRKRAEAQLAYGALHDTLTGLPNRALFVDRLEHAAERIRRGDQAAAAVLFLDLDRFKVVNESLGHRLGDRLLQEVARRMEAALRPGDTLARFGGDEFTVLAEGVSGPLEATHLAERLQEAVSEAYSLEGHELFCTASLGLALARTGHERAEELLRNADAALSRAKASGKNRLEVFDRAMHAEAMARLQLETDLRRALERGELRLHYQPVVALDTGRIESVEALLRWRNGERGDVPPDTFIPLAEETGLIVPLGRWVMEECCRQVSRWREAGSGVPGVSVNLSARQFADPELVEHLSRTIGRCGMDPRSLVVEITETVLLEHEGPAVEMLNRLRELGVRLSMDDFGTGYSSLGYLHRFPLDLVKIDRSFVRRMDRDARSAQLVHAIVSLARNLRVRVVAEGVETPGQLAALRGMGCDYAQGFLFSPALPPDRLAEMLAGEPQW
jgi:diguanylate cyclase (GGDEF)-like protein/PAS domain S-box-containing protein